MPTPPQPPKRRAFTRARLARLREKTEPLVDEEHRTALRSLLQAPLQTPDGGGGGTFGLIRRHREWLADWFAHHADWPLVVNAEAARLRKLPENTTDASRPAIEPTSEEPFNRSRYVLLSLALAALERGDRQITLNRLAEHIAMALAADETFSHAGFMWNLDHPSGRRDFVHVLRFLVSLGVLHRVQGTEEFLLRSQPQSDALYNVSRPVLAMLLAARRSPSLVTATDFETRLSTLLDNTLPETPEARNRALRTRLVRQLLDNPVLYYDTLNDEARTYLDRQRGSLLRPLIEGLGLYPEVRAEGIALVDLDGDCTDAGLPEEGTEGHLTLLLATWLADRLRQGNAGPLTLEAIRDQTSSLIQQHRHHWRSEVKQPNAPIAFTDLVLTRLAGLSLIEVTSDNSFRPLPAIGRFALRMNEELSSEGPSSSAEFDASMS